MTLDKSSHLKKLIFQGIFALFLLGVAVQFFRGIEIRTLDMAVNAVHAFGTQLSPLFGLIYIGADLTADLFFASVLILTAIVIFRYKPDSWVILFFSLALISFAMSETDTLKRLQVKYVDGHLVVYDILSYVPVLYKTFSTMAWFTLFYVFPDGKFTPSWTKFASILWIFLSIVWMLFPFVPFNPVYGFTWDRTPVLSLIVFLLPISTGIYVQIYRWRNTYNAIQKQQVKWVVIGGATMLFVGSFIRYLPPPSLTPLGVVTVKKVFASLPTFAFPFAVSVAVRQHRLWDLNPIISRTLVWFIMTTLVVLSFVIFVGGFGGALQIQSSISAAIATGLIAILFQPVRLRIQKRVDRYIFGMRDDPWIIMNRLHEQEQMSSLSNVLINQIVETIAQMLKLPYVAIQVDEAGNTKVLAQYGNPQAETMSFDMLYESRLLGKLDVAPRAVGETFDAQDKQLLNTLAQQVAAAVNLISINTDLQYSREHLVIAREEELQRLQRDLHDGLGSKLAANTLNIGTARSRLFVRPNEANSLLEHVEMEIASVMTEIQYLIYALHPPGLNQKGLVGAIKDIIAPYHSSSLNITFNTPEQTPKLHAETEVAIYRIVQEALTNVIRHAHARNCTINLTIASDLRLEIIDDGQGIREQILKTELGLKSMRDRAEEVGGNYSIKSRTGSGTSIMIHIPISGE